MTHHTDSDHDLRREHGDEQDPAQAWSHSLAAAAICLGTAAAIALIAILG